jgi:hypothetical protein
MIVLLLFETNSINYFGLVSINGSDGSFVALINGVTFRFDVPQTILRIDVNAEPHLVMKSIIYNFRAITSAA